jgi:hypothetical protein
MTTWDCTRWLKERRDLRRFKKRWRREFKGGAVVMSTWMDPDFVPPSGSLNPAARVGGDVPDGHVRLADVIAYRWELPNGEVRIIHPAEVTVIVRGPEQASRDARRGDVELAALTEQAELVADLAKQAAERVRVPCANCGDGTDAPNTLCPSCARRG